MTLWALSEGFVVSLVTRKTIKIHNSQSESMRVGLSSSVFLLSSSLLGILISSWNPRSQSVSLCVSCHFIQELLTFLEVFPSPLPVIIDPQQFLPCPDHHKSYQNRLHLPAYKPLQTGDSCRSVDEILLKYSIFLVVVLSCVMELICV